MSTDETREENVQTPAKSKWSSKLTLAEMLYRALIGDESAWPQGGAAR